MNRPVSRLRNAIYPSTPARGGRALDHLKGGKTPSGWLPGHGSETSATASRRWLGELVREEVFTASGLQALDRVCPAA
jgi:hypothetical protein